MNKLVLTVPEMIRYLSQWKNFSFKNFQGHCILHKQLPGCGFTEFALTCPEPVVLCSPRKMLMENKKEQHGDDVYLVVNEFEPEPDIDADVSKDETAAASDRKVAYFQEMLQKQQENADNQYKKLFAEISEYISRMNCQGKSVKIIVTYDSAYLVKKILESMGIINSFYFCIDEFQTILDDSRFKSAVELDFLYVLQGVQNVMYVSATPMLDKYICRVQELAPLPYYELDWVSADPMRVRKPNLKVRTMSSVTSKACEIIKTYLDGNYEKAIVERDGQLVEVESKEAVFYVNSVAHIVAIIKKAGLRPEQVNILCSKTPENQRKLEKGLGKKAGFKIGKVPLKDEVHKMFTIGTRTVYLGADFYSRCARSFVFSDANYDSLSVDISNDLNQILGRQRLEENPWKNSAEFYYRVICKDKRKTQAELDLLIETKIKMTENLLNLWTKGNIGEKNDAAIVYQRDAKCKKYKDNYVSVNCKSGNSLLPVFNHLVLINDQRCFDIQQVDYADRFSVFCKIHKEYYEDGKIDEIGEFFIKYDQLTTYVEKIHFIVDFLIEFPEYSDPIISNLVDSDKIKQQLITLGASRIKGLGYNITRINQAMGITIFDQQTFLQDIYTSFKEGQKYTKKFIKIELGAIYRSRDYKKTPKANDLENWFEIRRCKITIGDKREEAFEIIKKK